MSAHRPHSERKSLRRSIFTVSSVLAMSFAAATMSMAMPDEPGKGPASEKTDSSPVSLHDGAYVPGQSDLQSHDPDPNEGPLFVGIFVRDRSSPEHENREQKNDTAPSHRPPMSQAKLPKIEPKAQEEIFMIDGDLYMPVRADTKETPPKNEGAQYHATAPHTKRTVSIPVKHKSTVAPARDAHLALGKTENARHEATVRHEPSSTGIMNKTLKPLAKSFSHALHKAIIKASDRFGLNPDILAYTVNAESAGSLFAKSLSKTSTSKGPSGFTDDTWMKVLKRYGAENGYPNAAAAIVINNGVYSIPNEKDRRFILNGLRRDPDCSMLMTAALTRENMRILEKNDIPLTGTTVYDAHFMGPGKAVEYNVALVKDPHRPISDILPVPIQDPANQGVLGTPNKPKKLHEVAKIISKKVPPIPVFAKDL